MTRSTPASTAAGAQSLIGRLPDGIDTLLGSWFAGGTELSGGEWQRISLARAVLRDAQILLLDEPTSAMDSWAETDWVNRFRDLARGRTAVIISHRLTTAMKADMIHVMEHGRIVESGSHLELLKAGGRYAEAWRAQMEAHPSHQGRDEGTRRRRDVGATIRRTMNHPPL